MPSAVVKQGEQSVGTKYCLSPPQGGQVYVNRHSNESKLIYTGLLSRFL